MYSFCIVHDADSNSAQIEWHVDVRTPNCKLKLENESPFARRLMPMVIRFSIGTSCVSWFSSLGLKILHNAVNVSLLIRKNSFHKTCMLAFVCISSKNAWSLSHCYTKRFRFSLHCSSNRKKLMSLADCCCSAEAFIMRENWTKLLFCKTPWNRQLAAINKTSFSSVIIDQLN